MKKTKKPTALTKKAGSKQLQKKASPQPSMWAQLESFMVKSELRLITLRHSPNIHQQFAVQFSVDENISVAVREKSLEEAVTGVVQKLNHSTDSSLKIINAVKL